MANQSHNPQSLSRADIAKQLLNPKASSARPKQASTSIRSRFDGTSDSPDRQSQESNRSSINGVLNGHGHGHESVEHQEHGQSDMITNLYKVENREYQPAKRQKRAHGSEQGEEDDEERKKKAEFNIHSKGGGVISEALQEMREKNQNIQGPPTSATVDLTGEDDDDNEVVFVRQSNDKEVCLGRIENAFIKAHKVPTPKMTGFQGSKSHWQPMKIEFRRRVGLQGNIIGVIDPAGKDFATVDFRIATVLAPLMDSQKTNKVRFQTRLDMRARDPWEYPGQNISKQLSVTINVYAPRNEVRGIGTRFSQAQVWLRNPLAVDRGVEILNPHDKTDFTPKSIKAAPTTSRYTSGGYIQRTNEEVKQDVSRVFDNLKQSDNLPFAETPDGVVTDMLPHQLQALYFMTRRESDRTTQDKHKTVEDGDAVVIEDSKEQEKPNEDSLWQERIDGRGRKTWYNVITGHEMSAKPEPALGGILADVMGLGKTLNVLALVVATLEQARSFAQQQPPKPKFSGDSNSLKANCGATLIVSPLSTIANWEHQMKTHIREGTFKNYYVYHGPKRPNDPMKLLDYDVVITTYSVVAADADQRARNRPNNPLAELHWFRIVLDEAHMIREQSTRQSKAVCALSAERRWAVTGTPVQNRLDDLGALLKFLRVRPFDEKNHFAQYIIAPFKTGDVEIFQRLRLLVDSITLRRLKDKLNLPGRKETVQRLEMTDDERTLYDHFAREGSAKVKAMIGNKDRMGGSSYAHVLRTILRLRMICAHGAELLNDEDWDASRGISMNSAIDLEDESDKPDKSPRQAFEMYRMMRENDVHHCIVCERPIVSKEEKEEEDDSDYDDASDEDDDQEDEILGYLTPCNHLICPAHLAKYQAEIKQNASADGHTECISCGTYIRVSFFELKQRELQDDDRAQAEIRRNPRLAKHSGRYGGAHTKTRALVEALQENEAKSAVEFPRETPIKSVIFSSWTSHLDLIQIALTDSNIKFTRLDGSMGRSQRAAALSAFDTAPEISCILISIQAGGLGLNLTAASRVYVMEPQFNPAAEAQAIERVHRLGQKRDVEIVKFIMQNSFEEKILKLQNKKKALAEMSMERSSHGKLTRQDQARQKLDELKELFK